MPREKATGKRRGFAFLMYEDQRSTILAVDNLNGAELLGRTLRVDHVQNYKQKEMVDGKWVDRESERLNVKPEPICTSSRLPYGSSHSFVLQMKNVQKRVMHLPPLRARLIKKTQ
jgi:RNA recognition motif-containing protein